MIFLFLISFTISFGSVTSESNTNTFVQVEKRIIGGKDAPPKSFGFMVSVQIYADERYVHHCGGALISPRLVVSAAHCYQFDTSNSQIRVLLGSVNIALPYEQGRQAINVAKIINYSNYKRKSKAGDLALIQLSHDAILNEYVQLIGLPTVSIIPVGTSCYVIGWGATEYFGTSNQLQFVRVTVITSEDCVRKRQLPLNDGEMCAEDPPRGFCSGDSGGPLVCPDPWNPPKWALMGVVSRSRDPCGAINNPGVYTNVGFNLHQYFIQAYLTKFGKAKGKSMIGVRSSARKTLGSSLKLQKPSSKGFALLSQSLSFAICEQMKIFKENESIQDALKTKPESLRGEKQCAYYLWNTCNEGASCNKFQNISRPCKK